MHGEKTEGEAQDDVSKLCWELRSRSKFSKVMADSFLAVLNLRSWEVPRGGRFRAQELKG